MAEIGWRCGRGRHYQGELGNVLTMLGGVADPKALTHRCCGSFLSAARADVVTPLVNEIIASGVAAGAERLVTVFFPDRNFPAGPGSGAGLPVLHSHLPDPSARQ